MKIKLFLSMITVVMLFLGCENGSFEYNGLEWKVGPDRDITWHEANRWIQSQGGNWRMPTRLELQDLCDSGIANGNWGEFENSGWYIWSGDEKASSSAWDFDFYHGNVDWDYRSADAKHRVFAVQTN